MRITPEDRAREIIRLYDLQSPEGLHLEEIANAEQLIIEERELRDCMGKISFTRDCGLIKIDSKIREPGQKRFVTGHEMGHFFNEKGLRDLQTYRCIADDLFSFKVNKRREDDANRFSTELLMHKPWFCQFTTDRKINFGLIKETAAYFRVSLTAAAIRYAHIGTYPVAIILSRDGKTAWNSISSSFPLKWIPKGYEVRKESAAYAFFSGKEIQAVPGLMPAYVWFGEDVRCRREMIFYEENVPMKHYHSVLTMLWESEF